MLDAQRVNGFAQLIGQVSHAVGTEVEQRQHKLFTTVSRSDVEGTACKSLHNLRNAPQRLIARLVAIPVVVGLEVVDIDQQEREGTTIPQRLLPHAWEVIIERATVLEPGKAVTCNDLAQQTALKKRSTQLALHSTIDERTDCTGYRQYDYIVGNRCGRF